MAWVELPLATQDAPESSDDHTADASHVSMTQLVNLQLKPNPPGSRKPFHVASVPGLTTTGITTPSTGHIRGICVAGHYVFVIQGTAIYYALASNLTSWTQVPVGSMPGAAFEYCRMVDAGTHVVAVDGTNARVITTAESVACDIEGFRDVTYQDGITLYAEKLATWQHGRIYASDTDAPGSIDALNFTTVDALPGPTIGLVSDHRELFAFKTQSIEYYQNVGSGGFPFQRSQPGLIERGLYTLRGSGLLGEGLRTLSKRDHAVFFLGDDLRVYMMQGYQPTPISTPWVERRLAANNGGDFWGQAFMHDGSLYYAIGPLNNNGNGPYAMYVCDVARRLWHIRKSPLSGTTAGYPSHIVEVTPNSAAPRVIVEQATHNGVSWNSTLYLLDPDATNDTGASSQTARTMTLPAFAPGEGQRVRMSEIYLDMQTPSTSGTITMQWSDDGGTTFSSAVSGVLTEGGVRWSRLGMFRQRIFRFNFAIDSKLAIMGVRGNIEVGA